MTLKALTYLNLPGSDVRKEPGETISDEEWEASGQSEDDLEALIKGGSVSKDMNAEIHPAHAPVAPGSPSLGSMVENAKALVNELGDDAPAELRAFANLDYAHVIATDSAEGASDAS